MHAPAYPSPSFAGTPLPRSSLALFQTTRPSPIKDNGSNRYAPDGEQRNRGLEWNIAGVVTPGLRLAGGATYLKAINTRARARLLNGRTAMGSRLVGQHARRMGYPWLPGLNSGRSERRYVTRLAAHPVAFRAGVENAFNQRAWNGFSSVGAPRTVATSVDF